MQRDDAAMEQFPLLADEGEFWCVVDALWAQDPETFEDEPQVRAKARRGLRVAGVLLVIVALLAYFVVPFGTPLFGAESRSRRPTTGIRLIPVAPKHADEPKRAI